MPLPPVNSVQPAQCTQGLVWTITDAETGEAYPFVQVQDGEIVVQSNDPDDAGVYQLILTVKPDGSSPAIPR